MTVKTAWKQVKQRDPFPPPRPEAVPGCTDCLKLVVRRKNAGSAQDYSGVSDINVTLRGHLSKAHR